MNRWSLFKKKHVFLFEYLLLKKQFLENGTKIRNMYPIITVVSHKDTVLKLHVKQCKMNLEKHQNIQYDLYIKVKSSIWFGGLRA